MKKHFHEFIGTFFTVLVAIIATNHPEWKSHSPWAIGGIYFAMLAFKGHRPTGYFNPALTVALLIRRKMSSTDAVFLITAQFLAGFAAAAIGQLLHDCQTAAPISWADGVTFLCGMGAESLGAFALGYAVVSLQQGSESQKTEHIAHALSLGVLLAVLCLSIGGISAGTFNPVVAVCAPAVGMLAWENLWLALFAAFFGAVVAGTVIGEWAAEEN